MPFHVPVRFSSLFAGDCARAVANQQAAATIASPTKVVFVLGLTPSPLRRIGELLVLITAFRSISKAFSGGFGDGGFEHKIIGQRVVRLGEVSST